MIDTLILIWPIALLVVVLIGLVAWDLTTEANEA